MSKAWTVVGIVGALVVHAAILLFGGVLFFRVEEEHASKRDVELVAEDVKKDKADEQPEDRPKEEIKQDKETPPDPNQAIKSVDSAVPGDDAPALDAASLSAIEAALNGGGAAGGSSDFGGAASLQGGGRIGGTGKVGSADEQVDAAFSMSEIDQRPRAVHQVAGAYPSEMRARNVEGVVTLIFIVDETGRVANPRVEKASHPEFEKPALDAVRQWKFEPAVKAGKRVSCRMRVSVRFQPR